MAAAILLVLRFIIAGIFIRAGAIKLASLKEFRLAVTNYEIVPANLAGAAAVIVAAVEVIAGLLLLLGVLPGVVAAVLAALLVCFSAAITVNLARGRVFDCGCDGSTTPQTISWGHVRADLLLAAAAAAISVAPPAGLGLLHGPGGVFRIGIPGGSGGPVLLAAALSFLTTRLIGAGLAARRLMRTSQG
jgi:uncharacterized membrane protein YphA (DoxX/SURF4 family)